MIHHTAGRKCIDYMHASPLLFIIYKFQVCTETTTYLVIDLKVIDSENLYISTHFHSHSQNIRFIAQYRNELGGVALNVIIETWWGRRWNVPPRYITVI